VHQHGVERGREEPARSETERGPGGRSV